VAFQSIPRASGGRRCIPFDEGLTVEARDLDGHDGTVDHLLDSVGWSGNDSGNVAVFEAVEE